MADSNDIKSLSVSNDESEKSPLAIVKLEAHTCVIPPPQDASKDFHQLSWCVSVPKMMTLVEVLTLPSLFLVGKD
jgi:hypothetical protein